MNNQNFTPYEYAVIRYYHDTSTDEFLNIGVAVYCPAFNYFKFDIIEKYRRITRTFEGADGSFFSQSVKKLNRRFDILTKEIENQQLEFFENNHPSIEDLLRRHLRKESSFQYSNISTGIAQANFDAVEDTFDNLFNNYVLKYWPEDDRTSRTEKEVWQQSYKKPLEKNHVLSHLKQAEIKTKKHTISYEYSYKNGQYYLIEPISFDMMSEGTINNKANRYLGRNVRLNQAEDISHLFLLLGKPKHKGKQVQRAYNRAKDILNSVDYYYKLEFFEEHEAKDVAKELQSIIEHAE